MYVFHPIPHILIKSLANCPLYSGVETKLLAAVTPDMFEDGVRIAEAALDGNYSPPSLFIQPCERLPSTTSDYDTIYRRRRIAYSGITAKVSCRRHLNYLMGRVGSKSQR